MEQVNKNNFVYNGKMYTKQQLALGYNATLKVLKSMIDALNIYTGKRKILYPNEIRAIIQQYGDPDWSAIPEKK